MLKSKILEGSHSIITCLCNDRSGVSNSLATTQKTRKYRKICLHTINEQLRYCKCIKLLVKKPERVTYLRIPPQDAL